VDGAQEVDGIGAPAAGKTGLQEGEKALERGENGLQTPNFQQRSAKGRTSTAATELFRPSLTTIVLNR
jgi:hypothetical protein